MSSLAGALGSHTVSSTSSLLVTNSRHTQDLASRWYYATACEIRQHRYDAQSPYNQEPDVTFLDQAGNIIPLRVMLDPRFSMPQWDQPWTKGEGVGQRITVRILVSSGTHKKLYTHTPQSLVVTGSQKRSMLGAKQALMKPKVRTNWPEKSHG